MKKEEVDTTMVWKSKRGNILMSEMDTDHLQRAYNFSEHRFLMFDNQAINAAEKAALFEEKMQQIEKEAMVRGISLESITAKDASKYKPLKERKRVKAIA
jgi:hypothetical protein